MKPGDELPSMNQVSNRDMTWEIETCGFFQLWISSDSKAGMNDGSGLEKECSRVERRAGIKGDMKIF